jgi:hypothetical protein
MTDSMLELPVSFDGHGLQFRRGRVGMRLRA